MRLFRQTYINRPVLALLAAVLCAASCAMRAQAGAYTFSSPNSQRTINAGIVLLDSTTNTAPTTMQQGQDNPDPYVFYILSRRVDLLPPGWTIQNPLAAHNIAADAQRRWNARTNTSYGTPPTGAIDGPTFYNNNGGAAYQFGQSVTPAMAPYWEVSLADASTQDLQQFDILLVNLGSGDVANFRPSEVDKLRRFVDGGGTLLVEDNGGGNVNMPTTMGNGSANGSLFFNATLNPFQYASGTVGTPRTAQLPSLQYRHPILSAPYFLALNELNSLGSSSARDTLSAAPGDFTTVLFDQSSNIVLTAAPQGAGAIVLSSVGSMAAINDSVTQGSIATKFGVNSGPFCGTNFQSAPTQDLKFLCDIIAWGGGHTHEHQNSSQNGETLSALPSPVRTWNYVPKVMGLATVSGATISGNFVYTTDSGGVLHAFDLYPYEDLDGDGDPDDGTAAFKDYDKGASYDEVWHVAAGTSAPTVVTRTVGGKVNNYVYVEDASGKVNEFLASSTTAPAAMPIQSSSAGAFSMAVPPAPTFYDGRLYASEPDGTLFAYDFSPGRSASTPGVRVKLMDAMNNPAIPIGAPAVGGLPSDGPATGTTPQSTDIVAMVPTKSGLYSLFLGARGEQLRNTSPNFTAGHMPTTAVIDIDPSPLPAYPFPYTLTATPNDYAFQEKLLMATANQFSGTLTNPAVSGAASPAVYADYDVNLATSTSLTRTIVTYGGPAGGTGITSTPALDRFGNGYYFASEPTSPTGGAGGPQSYTVLTGFHDATRGARLPWRFRLPSKTEALVDADGVNYGRLNDFQFQGTPVVDSRGFVYALAYNSTTQKTALLCFNGQAAVTTAPIGVDVGAASLTQSDATTPGVSEFGDTPTPLLSSQYSQDGTGGPLTFSNFGASAGASPATLTPNLNEPEPVTISVAQTGATTGGTYQLLMHTNLVWYSILETNVSAANTGGTDIVVSPGAGISKIGSALFFVGSVSGSATSHLYSVPADPQAAGFTIAAKYVDAAALLPSGQAFVTDNGDTAVGATAAVVSGANGALIINGAGGVSAFVNRTTLVTDSSRVMELNQDGTAAWLADSTQESAGLGVTSLAFSRPASVTELTPNDYLVADTGNNRVVRFDRAGKVIWELTRFADTTDSFTAANYGKTGPLLSASEPNTLNQPTSVQIRQSVEAVGTANYTVVHYLVSDTGNYRILDIVDIYDASGAPVGTPHNLVWISHTHDKQQRQYRYESAAYFRATATALVPNPATYIVALVTNQRVGSVTAAGGLGRAAQDAPGGSVVLLNYNPAAPATDGYIATVIDHFQAYVNTNFTFDLPTALANAGAANPVYTNTPTTLQTLYIRNPRFLKAYTPSFVPPAIPGGPNLLLADDNGVFDLSFDKNSQQYFTQWGFTQADYQALANQAGPKYPSPAPTVGYSRAKLPFVPQSIQRTATDTVTDSNNGTYNIGRYLVVNGFSLGNVTDRTDSSAFGGEVFELAVPSVATGGPNILATDIVNTISRLGNTGPLAQPTFAFRLQ